MHFWRVTVLVFCLTGKSFTRSVFGILTNCPMGRRLSHFKNVNGLCASSSILVFYLKHWKVRHFPHHIRIRAPSAFQLVFSPQAPVLEQHSVADLQGVYSNSLVVSFLVSLVPFICNQMLACRLLSGPLLALLHIGNDNHLQCHLYMFQNTHQQGVWPLC